MFETFADKQVKLLVSHNHRNFLIILVILEVKFLETDCVLNTNLYKLH